MISLYFKILTLAYGCSCGENGDSGKNRADVTAAPVGEPPVRLFLSSEERARFHAWYDIDPGISGRKKRRKKTVAIPS